MAGCSEGRASEKGEKYFKAVKKETIVGCGVKREVGY
jgi:hypothetical protein